MQEQAKHEPSSQASNDAGFVPIPGHPQKMSIIQPGTVKSASPDTHLAGFYYLIKPQLNLISDSS